VALPVMDCANKEEKDWKKCWTYMTLWMQTRLRIWIIEYLQEGMCLAYLEVEYTKITHARKEVVCL
jgi:hypothetical protein